MEATIITGTITHIQDELLTEHPKKIATISIDDKQSLFVEFRCWPMIRRLDAFNLLDKVKVAVKYEAKTSRGIGTRFNNIYAKNIKKA